jgi:hypothetical protein
MFCEPSDSERAVLLHVWKISSSILHLQTDFRCLSLSVGSPERASIAVAKSHGYGVYSRCCTSYTANKEFSNKLSKNSVIGYITASLLTIPPTPAFFEAWQRSFQPHSSLSQSFTLPHTVLELNLHLRKVKC